MPSTSKKQSNFMKAVANNPKFAKRVGVSQKVGKDFEMADKKKGKYAEGGSAYPVRLNLDEIKKRSMKGETRPARPSTQSDLDRHARRQGEESKSESMVMRKAKGGGIERKGKTKGTMVKMAKGGSIDGIAKKGKTRTAYPKMKRGGSC